MSDLVTVSSAVTARWCVRRIEDYQVLKPDEPNTCIKENVKDKCGFAWIGITTDAVRPQSLHPWQRPELAGISSKRASGAWSLVFVGL